MPAANEEEVMAWGTTTYARRDYDARRPTGGSRWGRWHAIPAGNAPVIERARRARSSYATVEALCGWTVQVDLQLLTEDRPRHLPDRRYCQRCLRRNYHRVLMAQAVADA